MPLRVKFCDFWRNFQPHHNHFTRMLDGTADYTVVDDDPQLVFFSFFGSEHLAHPDAIKVFFTGEPCAPNFAHCDYALGFDFLEFGDRYRRFPIFAAQNAYPALSAREPLSSVEGREFANFVYSNAHAAPERDRFFHLLNARRPVTSAGRHLRNAPSFDDHPPLLPGHSKKVGFQSRFLFTLAFENCSYPGYTTEKIVDAFKARTLPIYWGNPLIARDFNPASFINVHDFEHFEAAVEEVLRVANSPERQLAMLNASPVPRPTPQWREDAEALVRGIVAQPLGRARRRPAFGPARQHELRVARRHRGAMGRLTKRLGPFA